MEKLLSENLKMFSFSHILILGITLLLVIFFYLISFKRKHKTKLNFVYFLSILGFLTYLVLPILTIINNKNVDILAILPLNLCGICFLTAIILFKLQLASVRAFVGFVGIFDALYNLIVIPNTLIGSKPFSIDSILYFVPFVLLLMVGLFTFSFGLVNPSFREVGKTIVSLIVVTAFMHTINVIFKLFNLSEANYFYTLYPSRDSVMETIASYLPYEFVYLIVYLVAITIFMVLVALFGLASNKKFVNDIPVTEIEEQNPKDGIDEIAEPQMNVGKDKNKWEEVENSNKEEEKVETKEENIGQEEIEKEINQIEDKLKKENIDIDEPDLSFDNLKTEEETNVSVDTNNVSFNNENTTIQIEEKPANQGEKSETAKIDLNDSIFIKDEPKSNLQNTQKVDNNINKQTEKPAVQANSNKPEKVFMQDRYPQTNTTQQVSKPASPTQVNKPKETTAQTSAKTVKPENKFKSLNSVVSKNLMNEKINPQVNTTPQPQPRANDDVGARLMKLNQGTFKTKSEQNLERNKQINRVKSLRSIVDKMGKKDN